MKKYQLTPEGAADMYTALCRLDNEKLHLEAGRLFNDPLGWLAAHFELTVHQIEMLRHADASFMLYTGAVLSSALLARRPFLVIGFNPQLSRDNVATITVSNTIYAEYVKEKGMLADGAVTVTLK